MKTILLVDDEANILMMMQNTLSRLRPHYRVLTASDGLEAWQQIQQQTIDLLWTDYQMPNLNGLNLIQHFRKHQPNVPTVLMSGNSTSVKIEPDLPPDLLLLAKPFTPTDIEQTLRKFEL